MSSVASALSYSTNPFSTADSDRREIWEMLMIHDFDAFVTGDWSVVANDFWEEGFFGIHAQMHANPSHWVLAYPNVASYRDEWLRQVHEFAPIKLEGTTTLEFLFQACRLENISIERSRAIGLKRFDGAVKTVDGEDVLLRFQSLYKLVHIKNRWKIAGFVGYLPLDSGANGEKEKAATPW